MLDDRLRAAASLGQIYSTARDMTRAMDEIVWAVDPHNDTMESLTNYVARYAHDFLSAAKHPLPVGSSNGGAGD